MLQCGKSQRIVTLLDEVSSSSPTCGLNCVEDALTHPDLSGFPLFLAGRGEDFFDILLNRQSANG